jgi:hypothetical protein
MEKYEIEFCRNFFHHYELPKGVVCGCVKTPLPYCIHFRQPGAVSKIVDPCGECCPFPFGRKFHYEVA